MRKKNSYHTSVKTCYSLGIQQILPEDLQKIIPKSTAHYWKSESEEKYVGYEFANRISKNLDQANIILSDKVKHERALFFAFCRIKIQLIEIIGKDHFRKGLRANKNKVVRLVERIKPQFGVKRLCSFLNLTPSTYSAWKVSSFINCPSSALNLCFRKKPLQISRSEIDVLRKFMTNPNYYHWPISSVWAVALRSKKVAMSLSSWYKYCKVLHLSPRKSLPSFKKKLVPLRASVPNQTWHADVSLFKTSDNVRYYIYTVVDNFSRMILSWDISTKLSGQIRLRSIERAIKEQFNVTLNRTVDLIVDGGTENNNRVIHNFIQESQVDIHKKIALKAIIQSNSIVEATYKIMKYRYFYIKPIAASQLFSEMDYFVNDYNHVRPHYTHQYKTPAEVHQGIDPINYSCVLKQAVKDRIVSNRKQTCDFNCFSK